MEAVLVGYQRLLIVNARDAISLEIHCLEIYPKVEWQNSDSSLSDAFDLMLYI